MAEAAQQLSSAYTQHWYPVLGVLGAGLAAGEAQQAGRALVQYFRGTDDGGQTGRGWDPVGPGGGRRRWQTAAFGSVDDVPRRKAWGQRTAGESAGEDEDLSPRGTGGPLGGEGLMTPRWVAKQQQRRPAAVVSLHALPGAAADTGALGAELARNRVCLAARGLAYTAVLIVGRAEPTADVERAVAAVAQRAGLDPAQLAVCRAGTPAQFQVFVQPLERALFARAAAYYADAFMHTQRKLAALPQLPVGARAEAPAGRTDALTQRVAADAALVARFSRFLPLRGWLVRYHFKLALFAECAGDRDTAQRCVWLAYVHLLAYVGEITAGGYLPPAADGDQPEAGWLWALNGGAAAGDVWQRAHSLRMFGRRWDEALELLAAVNLRLVRGWLYQSLAVGALRSMPAGTPRYTVAPVIRSGPGGIGGKAGLSPAEASPASASSIVGRASGYTGGSLDPLVFSVHAGEMNAATEQMMDAERARRRDAHLDGGSTADAACFVALGSETADADVLQAPGGGGWWPLGGFYAVVDVGRTAAGLVVNCAQDVACTTAQLPPDALYDACLAMAARQAAEHVRALALVLTRAGFGPASSYLWACVERHYRDQAALHALAASHGMAFGRALRVSMLRAAAADGHAAAGSQPIAALTAALRRPPPLPSRPSRPTQGASAEDGLPRPTTASAGFAFDLALAGVDAAAPDWAAADALAPAAPWPDPDSDRLAEIKTRGGEAAMAAARAPPARTAAGGSGGSLHPQWVWPESAAFLLRSAALASERRRQQLSAEERAYAGDGAGGPPRVFSASPGVENTYVSLWLTAERARGAGDACQLLAEAMASLAPASTEPRMMAQAAREAAAAGDGDGAQLNALLGLISPGSARRRADRFFLSLASELAEAHAAAGRARVALRVFGRLADRFRREGWTQLTAHALRWCAHCANAAGDPTVRARALFELLAPELAPSAAERAQTHAALDTLPAGEAVDVDMARIHAPVVCHAQWQHWELGDGAAEMPFQVTLDCRALQRPLRLRELAVEFSVASCSVRVVSGETPMRARGVAVAGDDAPVRVYSLGGEARAALELPPGTTVVLEGRVALGGDGGPQRTPPPDEAVALLAVAAVADMGSGLELRLRWPTRAPDPDLGPAASAPADPTSAEAATHAAENTLTRTELLLLGHAGVARACDTASPLAVTLPLPESVDERALRRAVRTVGPASSLAANRRWLHVADAADTARWVQLPTPPLLPGSGGGGATTWDEPAFSAYSRCRIVHLPQPEAALALRLPSVAVRAPAYIGEAFAVEIEIANTHRSRPIALVELDVCLDHDDTALADIADSASDLLGDAPDTVHDAPAPGLAPWLQLEPGDAEPAPAAQRPAALRGVRPVDTASGALQPQETRTTTVYVRFPAALLHGAHQSSAVRTAVVRCAARFARATSVGEDGHWDGEAAAQASITAVRPLHATAAPLPAHVASPVSVLSPAGGPPRSTSVPACELAGDGGSEYCFRRPVAITLANAGPWPVAVERVELRPPLADPDRRRNPPLRVQLAGTSVAAASEPAVVAAGASLTHVFVLDVFTADVVRVPGTVSPGTVEVCWRRASDSSTTDAAPVVTRMWLPPLELIRKQAQVEAEFSAPIARVGEPLAVCYRVLNPTRALLAVEAATHASDSFAYAGPRRTVLNLLPGHVGLLRFAVVPLAAVAPHADPAPAEEEPLHVPDHRLLGLGPHDADDADVAVELPPSNIAGNGWLRLPRLDIRVARRSPRSRSPESAKGSQSPPLPPTGLRGLLGSPAATTTDSLAAAAPPPTREISALALSPGAQGAAGAQRQAIAALAGISADDADGQLSPGLDADDLLPDYFAGRLDVAGAESDLEASDAEDGGMELPAATAADPAELAVLRYDQTAIFCIPADG